MKLIKIIIKYFKIFFINFIFLEFLCYLLISFSNIPSGLTLMVSVIADKEFSLVHYPNRKFNFSYACWESTVYYNEDGNRKYHYNNNGIKIALLGDSMIENAQLSDGEDIGSLLQKKLGNNYEITNFGVLSTGVYDHLQVYKKKIKDNYDLLIYLPDTTDITDNYVTRNRANQNMFQIIDNEIKKVKSDEEFWNNYFSKYNYFKRKYLFFVKEHSNIYKVYWYIKEKIYINNHSNKTEAPEINEIKNKLVKPLTIYEYFVNSFVNEFSSNKQKFLIVPTLKPNHFDKLPNNVYQYNKIKKIWLNKTKNFLDPQFSAQIFLKENNIYKFPYLSWDCDSHFSYAGAEFYSEFLYKEILKLNMDKNLKYINVN